MEIFMWTVYTIINGKIVYCNLPEIERRTNLKYNRKYAAIVSAAVHREYHREYRLWQYLCRDGTCQYCGYGNGKYPDNQLYHSDTYS